MKVQYTGVPAFGLINDKTYEVDDPDHETCSQLEHLTLVGMPGAYPWNWFRVVEE